MCAMPFLLSNVVAPVAIGFWQLAVLLERVTKVASMFQMMFSLNLIRT